MTAQRNPDHLIRAFLDEGQTELPDRAFDAVRRDIHRTRQRVVIGPWREPNMNMFARAAIAAAAVVALGVVGIGIMARPTGPGESPLPSPTSPAPSRPSSAGPSPAEAPIGPLAPGTYVAHPFGDRLGVTFTVPDGWETLGTPGWVVAVVPTNNGYVPPDGMGVGFLRVSSLNANPCQWSASEDDIAVGPSASDLITVLGQQTAYDVSDPSDVRLGGYAGKKVDLSLPIDIFASPSASPVGESFSPDQAVGCDEQEYRIWNGAGFVVHAQGPGSRWHVWSLDVDGGGRVVVLAHDYPGTSESDRAAWNAIVQSISIQP